MVLDSKTMLNDIGSKIKRRVLVRQNAVEVTKDIKVVKDEFFESSSNHSQSNSSISDEAQIKE